MGERTHGWWVGRRDSRRSRIAPRSARIAAYGTRLVLSCALIILGGALPGAACKEDPPAPEPTPAPAAEAAAPAAEPATPGAEAAPPTAEAAPTLPGGRLRFRDVAARAGITLPLLDPAAHPGHLVNQMGPGVAFLDHDGDGRMDLYIAAQSTIGLWRAGKRAPNRLFRNRGDGTFEDVSARAGLDDGPFAAGVAAADYDNDGHVDLFVATAAGPDVLYRNRGDGTFEDVTAAAGVGGGDHFSIAPAFADLDRDGWLDLYVMRYLVYDPDDRPATGGRTGQKCREDPIFCEPHDFAPEPDAIYRNVPGPDGTRRFEDRSAVAGIEANRRCRGMGIAIVDTDRDGDDDILLGCDPGPNVLLENRGGFRFEDRALPLGMAGSATDRLESNMGIAVADVDGDTWLDLYVTDTQEAENTLYLNRGGVFEDVTRRAGIGRTTHWDVAWGVVLADLDNDGHVDALTANGGWYPDVEQNPHWRKGFRQPVRWFLGDGSGRFTETAAAPQPFVRAGRAAAPGDIDDDGDLDVVVTAQFAQPLVLENQGGQRRASVVLRLQGTTSNRDAIGATAVGTVGGRTLLRFAAPHRGFQASYDPRLFFGLGEAAALATLEVTWPSGTVERFTDVAAGRYRLVEGTGRLAPVAADGQGAPGP